MGHILFYMRIYVFLSISTNFVNSSAKNQISDFHPILDLKIIENFQEKIKGFSKKTIDFFVTFVYYCPNKSALFCATSRKRPKRLP